MRRHVIHIFLLLPLLILKGQPPILENIALYGNTRTKGHIILRELNIREGELLSHSLLLKDREWLLRQDFLKRIEFQVKPGSTQDKRILMLVVQEKGFWSVSPILSNKYIYGWYAGARLTIRNIVGRRNRIDATFQVGGFKKIDVLWSNPWIGGKLRLFADLNVYHKDFRYRFKDYSPHFDERDTGILLSIGKGIGRKYKMGIRAGMEQIWVGDPSVTFTGNRVDNLSIFESFITFDSRDWPLYPKSGLYFRSWARWFGIFQPNRFQRFGTDIRFYSPIVHDNILAVQSTFEISQGTIPIYKRIHIGGGKTIRGYSTGSLSGENSFLTSIEYRFPIFYERNPLAGINVGYSGVLFIDAAATWYQHENVNTRMLHSSAGIGIHVIWDHWVLRAEYGNRGKGWGFINFGSGVKF